MQKVITVSLSGNAYQLDEDAYARLHAYLTDAVRALATNPDQSEIVADLEQAIADKCARYLSPHKTVIKAAEIQQVLHEMGPVDAADSAGAGAGATADASGGTAPGTAGGSAPAGRRLYQISEGAILSGVCTGIAAYFAIEVTLVRVIFIALFFLTGGLALLGYGVLMFIVPYASTSEERAAARGLPFNARVLVEGAKQKYAQFRQSTEWQGTRAEWRREWRRVRAGWRYGNQPGTVPASGAAAPITAGRYAAHVITGSVVAILGLVFALISVLWLVVLLSLLTTGAVLGFSLPFGVPIWVTILILVLVYQIVAWPIQLMRRTVSYSMGPYHPGWVEAWNGIVGLALAVGVIWYGYHHLPELRNFFDLLTRWWQDSNGGGAWT